MPPFWTEKINFGIPWTANTEYTVVWNTQYCLQFQMQENSKYWIRKTYILFPFCTYHMFKLLKSARVLLFLSTMHYLKADRQGIVLLWNLITSCQCTCVRIPKTVIGICSDSMNSNTMPLYSGISQNKWFCYKLSLKTEEGWVGRTGSEGLSSWKGKSWKTTRWPLWRERGLSLIN
jgi:hypothetical protein